MASAQEIYLDSSSPAEAPRASGWEYMWNGLTGKWDERNRQYREAVNEYNAQKLLTKAEWEREDTAYQRLVNDLKNAGINPYYALNNSSISLNGSNGQEIYKTNGKSSKKEKDDSASSLKGLITTAIILMKLLA